MPRQTRTIAILPIKGLDAAKQRLAGGLGSGSRQALSQAMYSDVVTSLRRVHGLEASVVVTADRFAQAAAAGGGLLVIDDRVQAGQSVAAKIGIGHALAAGFERVLLVPGDTPLIDPFEIDALLDRADAERVEVVVVPDRHGEGTNALLIAPPDALEPSFGPGSLERHVAAAREAGVSHRVESLESLALDVDTPEDLAELAAVLDRRRGLAPMTRGALRQLDRSRGRGTAVAPAAAAPAVEV